MKLISISIVAFGLSSQGLAIPISLGQNLPAVNDLTGAVTNIATTVKGKVSSLISPAVRSEVDNIAQNAESQVMTTLSAVQTLKNDVEIELSSMISAVGADNTLTVVPSVLSNLKSITGSFQAVQGATSLAGPAIPLTEDEVTALASTLQILQTLVPTIQSSLASTVSALPADVRDRVTNEVSTIVSLISPAVAPITSFALDSASTMTGDLNVLQIQALAGTVTSTVDSLLQPVNGLLQGLGL